MTMCDSEKLDDEEGDGNTKPDPPGESHSYRYALMWNTAKKI